MNPEALEYLQKLLLKGVTELNPEHIRFIKARRDYLTEEQKEKFASILEDAPKAKQKKTK